MLLLLPKGGAHPSNILASYGYHILIHTIGLVYIQIKYNHCNKYHCPAADFSPPASDSYETAHLNVTSESMVLRLNVKYVYGSISDWHFKMSCMNQWKHIFLLSGEMVSMNPCDVSLKDVKEHLNSEK